MSSQHGPSSGHVHLILFEETRFLLEIPIAIACTVCLNPLKYLRYLGWCVLGVEGTLADRDGMAISMNGALLNQGIYKYIVPGGNSLDQAVDLEVIKQQSQIPSGTTNTREDFRRTLLPRDGCCVWTGVEGAGMHIIPFARGDEWLQLIIRNRPNPENLPLICINDIQNGIVADNGLHDNHFAKREVVVLKTPNPILDTTDVPDRAPRPDLPYEPRHRCFPENSRFTMQWIAAPRQIVLNRFPNNNDAVFLDQDRLKPADLLLHYNYGAAAVKQWGKNAGILGRRSGIPRPSVPTPAPMGPQRVRHDDGASIQKRAGTSTLGSGQVTGGESGSSHGATADSWDEDDVMLYFWGNSEVARKRFAHREQLRKGLIEEWRTAVAKNPLSP